MALNPENDDLLRSYLLGELSGEQEELLEQRLLEDDDLFELCEAIEADLLAACARDELAPEERERVLRRLASSPKGREQLAFARSLNTVVDRYRPTVISFRRLARTLRDSPSRQVFAAIAAALLVAVGAWLLWPPIPDQPQIAHRDGHQNPPPPPQTLVSQVLVLSFETSRGDDEAGEELRLAAGTRLIRFQLIDLQGLEQYGSFRVVVRSKGDGTVSQRDLLAQPLKWGPGLVLTIPAEKLPAGAYVVSVTAGNGEELTEELKIVHGKNG